MFVSAHLRYMPSTVNTIVTVYFLNNPSDLGAPCSFLYGYPALASLALTRSSLRWGGNNQNKTIHCKMNHPKTSKLGWPAVDRQIVMNSPSQDIAFLWYYKKGVIRFNGAVYLSLLQGAAAEASLTVPQCLNVKSLWLNIKKKFRV